MNILENEDFMITVELNSGYLDFKSKNEFIDFFSTNFGTFETKAIHVNGSKANFSIKAKAIFSEINKSDLDASGRVISHCSVDGIIHMCVKKSPDLYKFLNSRVFNIEDQLVILDECIFEIKVFFKEVTTELPFKFSFNHKGNVIDKLFA
jgi:hypothetical protein